MPPVTTDKFPARITYINQSNGEPQCNEMTHPDDAIPPIPPDHAVVVKYADDTRGYVPPSAEARDFDLAIVDNDEQSYWSRY
jgi:hypothetical protein